MTLGALRLTLPMAPPICMSSLVIAPNASNANSSAITHGSGERS